MEITLFPFYYTNILILAPGRNTLFPLDRAGTSGTPVAERVSLTRDRLFLLLSWTLNTMIILLNTWLNYMHKYFSIFSSYKIILHNTRNWKLYVQTCDGAWLFKQCEHSPLAPESLPLQVAVHAAPDAPGLLSVKVSISPSSYLVSANNVREAAEEAFVFVVTFHQEMQIFLWLLTRHRLVVTGRGIQTIKERKTVLSVDYINQILQVLHSVIECYTVSLVFLRKNNLQGYYYLLNRRL